MARIDVVVGCDGIDADAAWVRLRAAGGHFRTLDWTGISMAALVRNDAHMTFEGTLEQITALRDTHDPLWIESVDGIEVVMLEKQHPKREAILRMFPQRLGERWMADRLSAQDAAMRMFQMPSPVRGGGFPKMVIIMIAITLLMIAAGIVLSIMKR